MKSLITRNPKILLGAYTVRGTRISVGVLQGMHRAGETLEVLAAIYDLSNEQVLTAVNFRNPKKLLCILKP